MGHYMSDDEIRRRYRDMHPGCKRIQILADLNGCSESEIAAVIKGGEDDMDDNQAMELYKKGLNDREIGEKLGRHGSSVYLWRKKNDLPPNGNKPKDIKDKLIKAKNNLDQCIAINADQKGETDPEVAQTVTISEQVDTMLLPAKQMMNKAFAEWMKKPKIMTDDPSEIVGKLPEAEGPSIEDLETEIAGLKKENLILRAILYGAGFDLNEFWETEVAAVGRDR